MHAESSPLSDFHPERSEGSLALATEPPARPPCRTAPGAGDPSPAPRAQDDSAGRGWPYLVATLAIALTAPALAAQPRAPNAARAEQVADSVLARLTLDEKVGQLVQSAGFGEQTGPSAPTSSAADIRAGRVGSFLGVWGAATTRRLQRLAVDSSRARVPLLFAADVIHGWRAVAPVGLAQAASFDTALVRQAARVAAVEASAQGLHWTFAPMVDIARDPRWGRVVEGAGEDPRLGSAMAAAQVRGFQGDSGLAAPTAVMATAKHFAAYGAAEGGRDYNSTEVTERTLLDVYFPPFEAAARAGAGAFMASFNDIGGTPAHASRWLLTDILRDRWRFGGLVVSDWSGINELVNHGVAAGRGEAAVRAIGAGVDVDMADNVYRDSLAALVRAERVPAAAVDRAVRRVLVAKARLGLFDDPYRGVSPERERRDLLTPAGRAVARQLAHESIVLLENRANTLPLSKALRSIAVIGPLADDARSALGNWVIEGRAADAVSALAGIRAALPGARVTYLRGVPVDTVPNEAALALALAAAARAARAADAVVLVLGEREDMSAEAESRASIALPGAQLALAQAVVQAARGVPNGAPKPVAVVLMNGRPLATPWLADSAPALVESWFLGVEHGNALADVLFGDVTPSGKLPMTVPRATGQIPIYYNHRNTGRHAEAANKYTSKYLDLPWTPLYPFGHGRSYTTFTYTAPRLARDVVRAGDSVAVQVDVTNAGARAGDEVVQLYVRDDAASVARPVRELKHFARVSLRPGETRTVRFTLGPDDLAFHALDLRRVVEPGTFTVWAGGSSAADAAARFRVTGDTLVLAPAPPRFW